MVFLIVRIVAPDGIVAPECIVAPVSLQGLVALPGVVGLVALEGLLGFSIPFNPFYPYNKEYHYGAGCAPTPAQVHVGGQEPAMLAAAFSAADMFPAALLPAACCQFLSTGSRWSATCYRQQWR